ncbi:MAG: hypothetical protein AB8C02_00990 [Halioglobus sp.]
MAKIVFYLATDKEHASDALTTALAFPHSQFAQTHSLCCSIMQPRAEDILAIPADSEFLRNLSIVLEIISPAGSPIQPWLNELPAILKPLLACVNPDQSSLLVATPRTLQDTGSKQQRYHYLMARAKHFSPSDYLDYYMNSHYRFGVVTPLANYIQNYVDAPTTTALASRLGMQAITFDNFSELQFDDINAYLQCDAILEAGPAASRDEALFVDRKQCQSFSMDVVFDSRVS